MKVFILVALLALLAIAEARVMANITAPMVHQRFDTPDGFKYRPPLSPFLSFRFISFLFLFLFFSSFSFPFLFPFMLRFLAILRLVPSLKGFIWFFIRQFIVVGVRFGRHFCYLLRQLRAAFIYQVLSFLPPYSLFILFFLPFLLEFYIYISFFYSGNWACGPTSAIMGTSLFPSPFPSFFVLSFQTFFCNIYYFFSFVLNFLIFLFLFSDCCLWKGPSPPHHPLQPHQALQRLRIVPSFLLSFFLSLSLSSFLSFAVFLSNFWLFSNFNI